MLPRSDLASWVSLLNAVHHCSSPKPASLMLFFREKGEARGHNSIIDENTPNLHIESHNTVHIRVSFKDSKCGKGFERNLIHFYFVVKKAEGVGHGLPKPGYTHAYDSTFPTDVLSCSSPTSPLSSDAHCCFQQIYRIPLCPCSNPFLEPNNWKC